MTTQPLTQETEPVTDETTPAGLRATIERLQAEVRDKDALIRKQAFQLAGIDPDKGMGKAIAATFDGEPTAEAILAYAKEEFEFEPAAAGSIGNTNGDPPVTDKVEKAQATVDALGAHSTGGGGEPVDLDGRIAAAEAAGRWDEAIALKSTKLTPSKG